MRERRTLTVHPNSMAARKWKRATWETSLSEEEMRSPAAAARRASRAAARRLYARAALADRRGDNALAKQLRTQAYRADRTTFACG